MIDFRQLLLVKPAPTYIINSINTASKSKKPGFFRFLRCVTNIFAKTRFLDLLNIKIKETGFFAVFAVCNEYFRKNPVSGNPKG
ncbi:MAG: hypothetical protein EAZ09_11175 [Oscillatoriales cyanobacterium]|nr:MAG: hypothetical protein EAZ18_06340 [Oscillatoriales cyanobacterium]TAH22031.1 MAG: hypothetical protein EAZ09_11175 [Oscillatoriales cyanobacterium]